MNIGSGSARTPQADLSVSSFISAFCRDASEDLCLIRNEETREAESNLYKGHYFHDSTRTEGRRRENKTIVGSICRGRKKLEKTDETDVLSPEHRWKIVEALAALCAVVAGQKWRIAMNRCFPDHYSFVKTIARFLKGAKAFFKILEREIDKTRAYIRVIFQSTLSVILNNVAYSYSVIFYLHKRGKNYISEIML